MRPDGARADVTVVIATMNRPDRLARCVRALLAGDVLPAQLVIVDQSADTATAAAVAAGQWYRTVPVRYLRQEPRGLAASRNLAIAHASHAIIAFTDDDCVPDRGWLAALLRAFTAEERPAGVTGRVLPLGPDRPGLYAVSTRASDRAAVYRGRALPWAVGTGGNAAVRREWLERVGGFDERLGSGSPGRSAEDMDLFYRLLRAGATLRYDPAAVVYHERQTSDRRLASRPAYGFGMGVFCALWTRRRDAYALWMLGRWCVDRGHGMARACVRRRWRRIREELLMLEGATRGVAYGLRVHE